MVWTYWRLIVLLGSKVSLPVFFYLFICDPCFAMTNYVLLPGFYLCLSLFWCPGFIFGVGGKVRAYICLFVL
jgi:hypothetical protein